MATITMKDLVLPSEKKEELEKKEKEQLVKITNDMVLKIRQTDIKTYSKELQEVFAKYLKCKKTKKSYAIKAFKIADGKVETISKEDEVKYLEEQKKMYEIRKSMLKFVLEVQQHK